MASTGPSAGPEAARREGLHFYPRSAKWRLRAGDAVLFIDLPGAGGEAIFDVLAGGFPAGAARTSERWVLDEEDMARAAAELVGARLMRARVDYEFYRFLPRPPVYATVLADPVERMAALHDLVLRTPAHPHHARLAGRGLHDFVCDPAFAVETVNAQARRVAGGMLRDPTSLSESALLEVAQANLGEFAFLGLGDRARESALLLAYTFGWPPPRHLPADGPDPAVARRPGIAAATVEAIEARTRVDRALVEFARAQFDARLRDGLFELLEQNAHLSGPHLAVLADYERLKRAQAELEQAWSWKVAERLRGWRRAVLPPGSRRDAVYQRVGAYIFARGRRTP